ncbi:MAG: glycoside hydrolase family 3 C-terminal domain-containing protein [Spirochaetia bacterium]
MDKPVYLDTTQSIEKRAWDLVNQMSLDEKASQLLHESKAVPRLEIPKYNWWNECLHGVARAGRATIFPQAIGLGATFDEDLLFRIASAISDEARAKYAAASRVGNRGQYMGLTFWTPNVNIFRDPRWGRGQETYGEDPFLTGKLGSAFVRGLQGEGQKVMKTAACAKHYAVHSGPEKLRHEFDAKASPKDLRETYLPAFEMLVKEGKVEAVMGAYNRTNGEVCCGSKTLLKDILREEWGFGGHVLSDCWAVRDFHEHHKVTPGPEESVALAISNGCDLNCGCTYEHVIQAVKNGKLEEKYVDQAVFRLMRTRLRLGMFDPEEDNPYRGLTEEVVDCPEHRKLARESAVKSTVLLKNSGDVLPLKNNLKNIYICGPNAANIGALIGNYYGSNPRIVTPLEGVAGRIGKNVTLDYRPGVLLDRKNINPIEWGIFEAHKSDVTIAVLGIDGSLEGEEGDALASPYLGDRQDIGLPEGQLDFLRRLKEGPQPVVTILLSGSPLAVPEVHELSDAVIWAGYPGEEGGNALSDILFGDVSPAGKLPVTFPKSTGQLPPYEDYSMEGRTYKYMREEPLYPFGFGLSYTNFEYVSIQADRESIPENESVTVTAEVRNIGKRGSDEVIQLYFRYKDKPFRLPEAELRGFKRVYIGAGETVTVKFTLSPEMLKVVDMNGRKTRLSGEVEILAGGCSPGERGLTLGAPEPVSVCVKME